MLVIAEDKLGKVVDGGDGVQRGECLRLLRPQEVRPKEDGQVGGVHFVELRVVHDAGEKDDNVLEELCVCVEMKERLNDLLDLYF